MQLICPTRFGEIEFYTIINGENISLGDVEVVSKDKIDLNSLHSNGVIITHPRANGEFSVVELVNKFSKNADDINNAIDKFLLERIKQNKG